MPASIKEQLTAATAGAANMDAIVNAAVDLAVAMESRLTRHGDFAKARELIIAAVGEAAAVAGLPPSELSPSELPELPVV